METRLFCYCTHGDERCYTLYCSQPVGLLDPWALHFLETIHRLFTVINRIYHQVTVFRYVSCDANKPITEYSRLVTILQAQHNLFLLLSTIPILLLCCKETQHLLWNYLSEGEEMGNIAANTDNYFVLNCPL